MPNLEALLLLLAAQTGSFEAKWQPVRAAIERRAFEPMGRNAVLPDGRRWSTR